MICYGRIVNKKYLSMKEYWFMAILVGKQNTNMISRRKKNTKFLTHKCRAYYEFEETSMVSIWLLWYLHHLLKYIKI